MILFYPAFVLVDNAKAEFKSVHGDVDDIVPLSYSRKAVKTYSSADLRVIKGAGHGFSGAEEDKAIKYMLPYLKKRC